MSNLNPKLHPNMPALDPESLASTEVPLFRQGVLSALQLRENCPQFRILVIGKANAGKTTILQKVCNAKPGTVPIIYDANGKRIQKSKLSGFLNRWTKSKNDDGNSPEDSLKPTQERGNHNIEHQITYPGSNFVFHDSRGLEAGTKCELDAVLNFIKKYEQNLELKDQLHAIWYCVPMDDPRPISGGEKMFFSQGTGRVPVVMIFTKFDALEDKCFGELLEQGKTYQEANAQFPELALQVFRDHYLPHVLETEFPPKKHVCLSGMNQNNARCPELSEETSAALDDDVLVKLFVSTQANNLDLCIKRAIELVTSSPGP